MKPGDRVTLSDGRVGDVLDIDPSGMVLVALADGKTIRVPIEETQP